MEQKEAGRRKVFVDFEWDKIAKEYQEERKLASQEIIEFGAVMLNGEKREIGQFKRYVKPRFVTKMSSRVKELTGITDEMFLKENDFTQVLRDFIVWCEAGEGGYDLYSWSDNDLKQMKKESSLKEIPKDASFTYLLEHWFDLQNEFGIELGFKRKQSLEAALYAAGIDAVGRAHDALDDARNTAVLYDFLTNPEQQATTIARIKGALCPEEKGATLGEMFDLSLLQIQEE